MKYPPTCSFLLFWLLVLLCNCRGPEPKRMPDTLPDVRGYITEIKRPAARDKQLSTIVEVHAIEGIANRYPDASIRLDNNTLIEDATGRKLDLENLREGHEVEAWFEGEVMESMPVQAYAKAIRVKD